MEKITPGVDIQASKRSLHAPPKILSFLASKPYLLYERNYQNLYSLADHGLQPQALFAYNTLSTTAQHWR